MYLDVVNGKRHVWGNGSNSVTLEWRSERRKQWRRGSAMSWGSSYTQPPSSPASMGSPARTSQTHLPHCRYWELCWRWCISGISHPAQTLSAPLAIVFRAWEIHMLLIHYVSYIWDRKTLYGSRGGWNISILTGGELHVVIVGGPHSSCLSSLCHAACAARPGWPPVCVVLHKPPVTGQPQPDHCEWCHRQLPLVPAITLLAQPCLYGKVEWETVMQKSFVNSVIFY